jgi:hypothetical protein
MKKCCLLIALGCQFWLSKAQNFGLEYESNTTEYISTLENIIVEQETYLVNLIDSLYQNFIPINLNEGWNTIGYTISTPTNVAAALFEIHESIEVIKNNDGQVYIPQFSFNGIGDFTPGQGYQLKMLTPIASFAFTTQTPTPNIQFIIEGCTENTAPNYWFLANFDDGTCLIDLDNDSIYDIYEIAGCQDENACNYESNATDPDFCLYPDFGFTCNGFCIEDSDLDLVCDPFEIVGCLDSEACNYNPETTEIINCIYPETYYDCDSLLTVNIGDEVFGGIVFHINSDLKSGLVVSSSDQSNSSNWGCQGTEINGANLHTIGSGEQNTTEILNDCTQNNIAAEICTELILNGYDDWYLPSKDELNLIYVNLHSVGLGNFSSIYWSSSQYSEFFAWIQNFNAGSQNYDGKYANRHVRAIRSF